MKNSGKILHLYEIVLGVGLIIVATATGLGLWWSFCELSVVKQKQHELQTLLDRRWAESQISKDKQACLLRAESKRVFIDPDHPEGDSGWKDEYVIQLKTTNRITEEFGVDWYRPHTVDSISSDKPDFVNALPKFKYEMQRYLTLRLGDAENNQIIGVMDFRRPDRKQFPFDLYLDRDRDGNLAEDFIEDRRHVKGVCVPYKDGTTEDYSVNLYSYSVEPIGVAYQVLAGRYGIFEADKKRIQLLVIDNNGNAIFNDDVDVIVLDWNMDGRLDGSHQANDHRPLYTPLELPGGVYRVLEFDAPGRRMILKKARD